MEKSSLNLCMKLFDWPKDTIVSISALMARAYCVFGKRHRRDLHGVRGNPGPQIPESGKGFGNAPGIVKNGPDPGASEKTQAHGHAVISKGRERYLGAGVHGLGMNDQSVVKDLQLLPCPSELRGNGLESITLLEPQMGHPSDFRGT
jgi:hypothetical protein